MISATEISHNLRALGFSVGALGGTGPHASTFIFSDGVAWFGLYGRMTKYSRCLPQGWATVAEAEKAAWDHLTHGYQLGDPTPDVPRFPGDRILCGVKYPVLNAEGVQVGCIYEHPFRYDDGTAFVSMTEIVRMGESPKNPHDPAMWCFFDFKSDHETALETLPEVARRCEAVEIWRAMQGIGDDWVPFRGPHLGVQVMTLQEWKDSTQGGQAYAAKVRNGRMEMWAGLTVDTELPPEATHVVRYL